MHVYRVSCVDMERRPVTRGEEIAARIDRKGACWLWRGNYAADGYPILSSATGNVSIIPTLWVQEYGPVPTGMVLTCVHPKAGAVCVSPAHYRPRPKGSYRRPRCRWGHDLTDPSNVVVREDGGRYCIACIVRESKRSTADRFTKEK